MLPCRLAANIQDSKSETQSRLIAAQRQINPYAGYKNLLTVKNKKQPTPSLSSLCACDKKIASHINNGPNAVRQSLKVSASTQNEDHL